MFTNTGKYIPQPEIDYFFWPCLSGEKYPPTFAGGGAYGSGDNGFNYTTAPSSGGTTTWPVMPQYSANQVRDYATYANKSFTATRLSCWIKPKGNYYSSNQYLYLAPSLYYRFYLGGALTTIYLTSSGWGSGSKNLFIGDIKDTWCRLETEFSYSSLLNVWALSTITFNGTVVTFSSTPTYNLLNGWQFRIQSTDASSSINLAYPLIEYG